MDYFVYKMYFSTPVHIGNGTLASSENTIMADTLFSALCCETGNQKDIDKMLYMAEEFKKTIVELYENGNKNKSELAREYGTSEGNVRAWIKK